MKLTTILRKSLPKSYHVPFRVRMKVKLDSMFRFQMLTAFSFMRLSWKALRGKICIMDTELTEARGGYKYKMLIISKLPVSKEHTYEDL